MSATLEIFTAGIWRVKPGMEPDFVSAWEGFATWVRENLPGASSARLLQDLDQPGLFLSIGPWESLEAVKNWRSTPEFADFFARAKELCESIEPHTLKSVVHLVPTRKAA